VEGRGSRRPSLLAGITLGAALVLAAAALAGAARERSSSSPSAAAGAGHTPVTLCHATGSATNPYVLITTDDDGVLGSGASGGSGHDGHERDIIPPFSYVDNRGVGRSYPGKNWDASGQALLANGCEAPPPPPPPGPPPPPPPGLPGAPPPAAQILIDLVVAKEDAPDPVRVGGTLVYTITVGNRGPDPATDVRLADPLPASLTVLSVAPSQGTCTPAPVLACSLGTIPAGGAATVVVRVRPEQTGRLVNTASAVGAEPEANPADNAATAETLVTGVTRPPTKPKPVPKPKVRGAVCVDHEVAPLSIRVGRQATIRVVVSAAGKPIAGARVAVRGAGVAATATTNGRGIAILHVRATRSGFVRVTLPGRAACRKARLVGVVTPVLLPPVTG